MMNDDNTGYRTRDLEVGHVVSLEGDDDDWAVTELVDLAESGVTAVYLRNADGTETIVNARDDDGYRWTVVGHPDEDLFND